MIGNRIAGRYQILETIGGGGMANVYKALDVILDRHVAVKVLQPQFSEDEQFIKRFRREAQAATSLNHPNVVNIFDVGEEGNTYYIVMEYVEGLTLKELIQQQSTLQVDQVLDLLKQMMAAIAHAHANQIIHRDIKPHNILVSRDGVAKVTDFGIARAISSATITHTNSVMGSVHYLSPEQARGGHITYRSDIYSLGIVLFEMVTGTLPFKGDTAVSIAIKHLQNEVPSAKALVPDLPQSIENVIRKATIKDPQKRYPSIHEMEEDVETVLDPARINEPVFYANDVEEDMTKAIPIIKDDQVNEDDVDKTIEVRSEERTIPPAPIVPTNGESVSSQGEAIKEETPSKKKKKKWWIIGLIVLFLLLGSSVAALVLFPNLFYVAEVEVPDVVEMVYEEAEEELLSLNLVVEREDIEAEGIEPGHVARQSQRPGSKVKEQSRVILYVSEGEESFELDDVTGLPIDRAERLLDEQGLTVERIERVDSTQSPGIVTEQRPNAGESVVAGETTVYLTYSVQSEIRLRNLEGEREEAAREYLNEVELNGRFQNEHSDTVAEGLVIRQSPGPFTMVQPGDDVQIIISSGPREEEPTEPEPEPEPEPDTEPEPTPEEPDSEPQDDSPVTKQYEVNQPVDVSAEDQEAGNSYDIRIVYRDATTEGSDQVFIEESISEPKTYSIPLEVSEQYPGSFDVYVNGNQAHSSKQYTID
ncbi:Stk1 family PASTA domain-containing Ser/Thr kinase [Alkalihalophilus lindianensis]|uniref:non-specific serine/threonine protein kinase n=1 Tax=Alkalihalophilus lindianensis TaxID=1630542 RepID=A0ABU3XBX9_9BACI|nr:Stk1 family PASTA domain-containing Ser/Thr kinase [Alkalihalophilus lindianensis]MDV2685380.1 Stk1 family PASTA domain-containing Ser/Thr kinase [Alkalihalophilus lindianensis]